MLHNQISQINNLFFMLIIPVSFTLFTMASPSQLEIIDNAMFCNTKFALAYPDPDQKWLIRRHLISLHREFSSLCPIVDTYIHHDGGGVNLLKVDGYLYISHSLPLVRINIWVHEHYPHMAPMVHVNTDLTNPIRLNHPFVDPSGLTTSSYLHTWRPFEYDLLGLARNLVNIFSLDHPFYVASVPPNMSHPSYVSKIEGMDRLWWMLHYDMIALREDTNDEVEQLAALQGEMRARVDITDNMIIGLDHEKTELKQRVKEMTDEADTLVNWLSVNKVNLSVVIGGRVEDAFECVDEISTMKMEWQAEDDALEELLFKLDDALVKDVISHETYIKQVRVLAREQFFARAKLEKLNREGSSIFQVF
ncbi:putative ubiquitin E2 variant, ubiquitin-conjugating enzyme/RWD, steadiness box (SB) [Helianthus annuus]|nr:putative ubiquitin E2 variant, ubiquitin-conjugating enzyme/RWD, steadiness box (SB) [Helianthus annuus]KAJ0878083.1 putative ubiquitin E2 variant, ubiquitin-conjugating enzyme/RWD, steadiness box (SB) [Helianthus annuus]KAJ0882371.1 putative ubiquitin E2 variant, ubiquitin-conjugating enzyme/RWD, steadiness box (SB) [Helianthus annuus]